MVGADAPEVVRRGRGCVMAFTDVYLGHQTLIFPEYRDLATGHTLVCQPGQSYNAHHVANPGGTAAPGSGHWQSNYKGSS